MEVMAVALGECPRVVVVGAGAAGTLSAIHLIRSHAHSRRGRCLDVVLVDPAEQPGRGVAYSTTDSRHQLNVPASGMSALPDEPGHFLDWLRRSVAPHSTPGCFARRQDFATYLSDTLGHVVATTAGVSVTHHRSRAESLTMRGGRAVVGLADGTALQAEAVVLAPGIFAPGTAWAPAELEASPRFVADPWSAGALARVPDDRDVLLVGTGLTAVDVALTLDRTQRRLHMISRRGRLPAVHSSREYAATRTPPRALVAAASSRTTDLEAVRWLFRLLLRDALRRSGDWRAAFDAVRPLTARLWSALDAQDRLRFLREDAAWWDLHRHRMAPSTAATLRGMRGRLTVDADQVSSVAELGHCLEVRLASGRTVRVGAVVNCTGPLGDVRRAGDPLLDRLLAAGTATAGPLGLGLSTVAGRLVDARGTTDAPVWTLGAMRRGELWESTAVPEIREQAVAVAVAVSAHLGSVRRRTRSGRLTWQRRDTVAPVPSGTTAGSPSGRWHAP